MSSLEQRLTARIDRSVLSAIVPRAGGTKGVRQQDIINDFAEALPWLLDRFDVTTPLRIAHLLAQIAHESDSFCTVEEYATGAAYEDRADLGNTLPGDGKRFKGRGPIQLTGRKNYQRFTTWLRKIIPDCPDFVRNPELVATFPWAAWSVFFFWSTNNLNAYADRDDLTGETKVVNGGTNGLASRAAFLVKAKTAIATLQADRISGEQSFPVLRRGMSGDAVAGLQRGLAAAGYYLMSIDGDYGAGTEGAVKMLQRARGLDVDGIAGRDTFAALSSYLTDG